ncbi:MAG: type II/IV secretion system ATPase subunit [Acidilobaceae archaeon]
MKIINILNTLFRSKTIKTENTQTYTTSAIEDSSVKSSYEPEMTNSEYIEINRYKLIDPWAWALILESKSTGERVYYVSEAPMSDLEKSIYGRIMKIIEWEIKPYKGGKDSSISYDLIREYFIDQVRRIVRVYSIKLGAVTRGVDWHKILYYLLRDTVGYGPLEPLMRDPYIEDISCDGVGKPVYIWHQMYESMPTNIRFNSDEELDSIVLKLAHIAGKHISVAFPIVDAILPGGHRLAATFKREISVGGSSFTIRKFREKPLSIVDLIIQRSINSLIAGYLWLLVEYKMPGIIMGVTGSGKTTMLNAIATLLRPNIKVVTIEDTPELRLTLENWVQLVSRPSYSLTGSKIGEVTLYDLVKVSLRYRPDVIIVGEIRGEEAYVLFQAIATGHGGLTTAHAESIYALVRRLTSPPMNIPQNYIPLMKWALLVKRIVLAREGKLSVYRRVSNIWEIRGPNDYENIAVWDPPIDSHRVNLSNSNLLRDIAQQTGLSLNDVIDEVKRRAYVLEQLALRGERDYRRVAEVVYMYYINPDRVLSSLGGPEI